MRIGWGHLAVRPLEREERVVEDLLHPQDGGGQSTLAKMDASHSWLKK